MNKLCLYKVVNAKCIYKFVNIFRVVSADINQIRLDMAKSFEADVAINTQNENLMKIFCMYNSNKNRSVATIFMCLTFRICHRCRMLDIIFV